MGITDSIINYRRSLKRHNYSKKRRGEKGSNLLLALICHFLKRGVISAAKRDIELGHYGFMNLFMV